MDGTQTMPGTAVSLGSAFYAKAASQSQLKRGRGFWNREWWNIAPWWVRICGKLFVGIETKYVWIYTHVLGGRRDARCPVCCYYPRKILWWRRKWLISPWFFREDLGFPLFRNPKAEYHTNWGWHLLRFERSGWRKGCLSILDIPHMQWESCLIWLHSR